MRYRKYIRRKYAAITGHVGTILLGTSFLLLVPLVALLKSPDEARYVASFAGAALTAAAGGLLCKLVGWRSHTKDVGLGLAEGGVVVLLSWVLVMLVSALPFRFSGILSFQHAFFESISGWTTTGLSVMDVANTPNIFLLWRSLMQFAGGAGLAIIMLSAILGPHGRGLYQAEGRTEQLVPNVKRSANMVVRIYLGYTIVGIVLYRLAGMPLFDAVNHAFAAISTGGFSTRVESIGFYDNAYIEAISIALMLLGATNFAAHYLLVRRKFGAFFRTGEVRLSAALAVIFVPIVFCALAQHQYAPIKWVRVSLFEVLSALTTTGYSTTSYSDWSDLGIACLLVLMLIGGGICSTAGGIKQYRIFLLLKSVVWDIRANLAPASAVHENYIWRGESKFYIDAEHVREAGNFLFVYLVSYVIGVLIFLAHGFDLRTSLFEFASALGTVGLSVGITGPGAPPGILWTEMAGMFFGRLEFFVIYYSLIKIVRDATSRA